MSDPTAISVDPPPINLPPPSDQISDLPSDFFENVQNDDVRFDDLDFDFSFDDLCMPDDLDDLLNTTQLDQFDCSDGTGNPNFGQFGGNFDQFEGVFKSTSNELRHPLEFSGDRSWNCDGSGVLTSDESPEMESNQVSGYLNVPSPESNGSNRGSNGKETEVDCGETRSVSSSKDSNNSSVKCGVVVDQKVKLEPVKCSSTSVKKNCTSSSSKRKKECDDDDLVNENNDDNVVSRINKYRKSDSCVENNDSSDNNGGGLSEEEERRKARLVRNRESAQLSRQRKKHYVEELEDKVRNMHSTIQDLNSKISYFIAENATLRQQMGSGVGGGAGGGNVGAVPPPAMGQPPPGMYPHPAMMYPWMPCPPPYMMKPQGSQVPLVPIPRLKPQQPAQATKTSKKVDSKKSEGPKTKKVAGVSFIGLLICIMFFGGLVPMVNVKYGGVREAFTGGESYNGGGFYDKHRGRVLMVNKTDYGENYGDRRDFSGNSSVHGSSEREPSADEFVRSGNGSEPLVASLYVPRNDKLVKIDGNLIIHSVLASEKAMASNGKGETGLAVPGDLAPAIPVPINGARHPHLMALGSGSANKDTMKSPANDGKLQQWFREGLAGPMLSAGMCTEVFQFDVSAASASGAIVPATSTATRNITEDKNQTSMHHPSKGRNRRILHGLPIPLPESSNNISKEHSGRSSSQKEDLIGNKNTSSMVVSVLFDPREGGDADVDGVMGSTKSITRIFVVVLIDSVKYVTYSCMLPFKGSATHLVTT